MSVQPSCQECHWKSWFMSELRAINCWQISQWASATTVTSSLKAAYSWTEAPRLCLTARCGLTGLITITELVCARAVFTKHYPADELRVIATSRVDDKLLLGKRSDPVYQRIEKFISEQLDAKKAGKIWSIPKKLIFGSNVEACVP